MNRSIRLSIGVAVTTICLCTQGCVMTPEQIAKSPTWNLCGIYAAPLNPHYFDPVVKAELDRRGAGSCADPAVVQSKVNASMGLIQQGTSLMSQSSPGIAAQGTAAYAPGAITAMKVGERGTGTTKQCEYALGNTMYTRTVGAAEICPLSIVVQ